MMSKRGKDFWAILLYVILGYFVFLHVLVFDLVDMYYEPLFIYGHVFLLWQFCSMAYVIDCDLCLCFYYLIHLFWRLEDLLVGWR